MVGVGLLRIDRWYLMPNATLFGSAPLFSCLRKKKFESFRLCSGERGGIENRRWAWESWKNLIFLWEWIGGKVQKFLHLPMIFFSLPSPKQRINLSIEGIELGSAVCCMKQECSAVGHDTWKSTKCNCNRSAHFLAHNSNNLSTIFLFYFYNIFVVYLKVLQILVFTSEKSPNCCHKCGRILSRFRI